MNLGSSSLRVTLHHFEDQRPERDRFLVSVTLTNEVTKLAQIRRYQELSCVLKDGRGQVVGVKQCGTAGLLPQESYRYDLEFVTLSDAPVAQFQVLDTAKQEPLVSLDLDQGYQFADIDPRYAKELYRGEHFRSPEEWQRKVEDWAEQEPASPGHLASLEGYRIGVRVSRELNRLTGIRNDKWKHCLVGAEIALIANVKTAIYAGWFKEREDLTDGLGRSEFEEADFEATKDGALQTEIRRDGDHHPARDDTFPTLICGYCPDLCEARWGNPYLSWNGRFPPG